MRPPKPYPDFPLFPHNNGQWVKKVRGKLHCFGVWADPDAALRRWLDERDELLAGRVPRLRGVTRGDAATLETLIADFLAVKLAAFDGGELSPYTLKAYRDACNEIAGAFGLGRRLDDITPSDFAALRATWAAKWGVVRLGVEIQRVKTIFNFAANTHLIPSPIRYGESFNRPTRKVVRLARADAGAKMFDRDELRAILDGAGQPLRAMILLGVNCGFGNGDAGNLPLDAVNLKTGWIDYPRPKTGVARRCPLWPETVAALREWLDRRPNPKRADVAALTFLTRSGDGWATNINDRPITHAMRKLLDKLNIDGRRNFYALRHTFETIGGGSRDQVAVNAIMGHDDGSMANVYREDLDDARLIAVAEYVRRWLFAE